MKKVLILPFIFLSFPSPGQQLPENKVPLPVRKEFWKSTHTPTQVHWENENGSYEAHFRLKGRKCSKNYTAGGELLETEEVVETSVLPQAAREYALATGTISEVTRIVKADGRQFFEVEVAGTDLIFNSQGDFLSKEKEAN